jgi:hypothetical protein
MKKKNENHETLFGWLSKNALGLVGIVVILVNVWLAYKLTPLVKDIELNKVNIASAVDDITEVKQSCQNGDEKIWEELRYIRLRIDSVYNAVR